MSDNVLSIKTRKSLTITQAEEAKSVEDQAKANIEAHLKALDDLRRLVADGQVQGLILVGRHVETGIFYQDVIFPMRDDEPGCTPMEAMTYVGALDIIKTQFSDMASWAPCLMPDGSTETPEELEDE